MGGRGSSSPNATGTNVRTRAMAGGASTSQAQVQQGQQTMHGRVRATTDTSGERLGPDVVGMSHTLADIQSMSNTQFAAYVRSLTRRVDDSTLISKGSGLDNGTVSNNYAPGPKEADFQRFLFDIGANGKPNIVDRQHFQQMDGDTIYRTVTTSRTTGETAVTRADRLINGEYTATGRGIYGAGLYFADTKSDSKRYGSGIPGHSAMVRAKLNQNARSISQRALHTMVRNEPKVIRDAFLTKGGSFKSEALKSIYALWKGYNVIDINGMGYLTVLDRSAMTVCDSIETW